MGELKWQCCRCGWVYDPIEEKHEKKYDRFEDLHEDYTCKRCGATKNQFKQVEAI
ncbi:MAG: rubredoxin [Promethearchaeota archaeon]